MSDNNSHINNKKRKLGDGSIIHNDNGGDDSKPPSFSSLSSGCHSHLSQSSLAVQALKIVLQHCMVPDLGWYEFGCERQVAVLWESISHAMEKEGMDPTDESSCEGLGRKYIAKIEELELTNDDLFDHKVSDFTKT